MKQIKFKHHLYKDYNVEVMDKPMPRCPFCKYGYLKEIWREMICNCCYARFRLHKPPKTKR